MPDQDISLPDNSTLHHYVLIGFMILLIISAVYLFINLFSYPSVPPENKLMPAINIGLDILDDVEQGYPLLFNRNIISDDDQFRFNLKIMYKVVDSNKEIIAIKDEQISVPQQDFSPISFALPGDISTGTYLLRAESVLNTQNIVAQERFSVIKKGNIIQESCSDHIMDQDEVGIDCGGICKPCNIGCTLDCDDKDICTIDYCIGDSEKSYECLSEPIYPCCGNGLCEEGEEDICLSDCADDIMGATQGNTNPKSDFKKGFEDPFPNIISMSKKLEKVKDLAKENTRQAISFCDHIKTQDISDQCYVIVADSIGEYYVCDNIISSSTKDVCLQDVAKRTMNSATCDLIENVNKRDSCYIAFAKQGESSVCTKITSPYLKEFCDELSPISSENPDNLPSRGF